MPRFEVVNPLDHLDAASDVLISSWPLPCRHYSPEFLRWRFSFPGSGSALAAIATDGELPVGFAAAIPRLMTHRDVAGEAYFLSYVAVKPEFQCRGIAAGLYDALLDATDHSAPIITFTEVGHAGERAALAAYARAGYTVSDLGCYEGFGYAPRRAGTDDSVRTASIQCLTAPFEHIPLCSDKNVLALHSTPESIGHYFSGPEPRQGLTLYAAKESIAGCAIARRASVLTSRAVIHSTMIENLFLPAADPDMIRVLCEAASTLWLENDRPTAVAVPNVLGCSADQMREAGLRAWFAPWHGYVCARDPDHPFLRAKLTNLEVA